MEIGKPIRVLVCGGRTYENWREVRGQLEALKPIACIIRGGAPGADRLAGKYADIAGIPQIVFPANWSQGKKAGPMRNAFMLTEGKPDIVIAFPGGRGTADMVARAKAAGVMVLDLEDRK